MSTFAPGHVGLNVTDIERAVGFYRDIFGWELQGEGGEGDRRFAFLGEGDALLLTLWQQADGAYDGARAGLHHLAFEVEDMEAVRSAETRVRAAGAVLHHDGVVRHQEGAASGGIFFEDPDGTRLEIYAPRGAEAHAAPSGSAPTCGFF